MNDLGQSSKNDWTESDGAFGAKKREKNHVLISHLLTRFTNFYIRLQKFQENLMIIPPAFMPRGI